MQTIEYRTRDKSNWGPGPWQDEPDKRQWQDNATGLPCLIVRGPLSALCGYVGVPTSHPAHGRDYQELDVDVHGGLTFAGACRRGAEDRAICHKVEPGEPDDVWWFGFDCAHHGDLCPDSVAYAYAWCRTGTYKDVAYVAGEVERLARQLASTHSPVAKSPRAGETSRRAAL